MTGTDRPDWREELYRCAAGHREEGSTGALFQAREEFAFLGDYKDSLQQCLECRQELQQRYEAALRDAESARDLMSVMAAEKVLKEFAAFPETGEMLARLQEWKQKLGKRAAKRRKALRFAGGLLLIGLMIGCIGLLLRGRIMRIQQWENAGSLEEQGNYEEALNIYRSLVSSPDAREAEKALHRTREKLGYQYIDRKRYDEALQLFQMENLPEGEMAAHTA